MGVGRVTCSTSCLILVMRVERSLLKSAFGVLDQMGMKLQSLSGFISFKTKLLKGQQSVDFTL
eukprot:1141621-Pelagomonas_calceolata.AAC.1